MKRVVVFMLGLFLLQSCAFVTSFKSFQIERSKQTSLRSNQLYNDNYYTTLILFDDGSCFLVTRECSEKITGFIKNNGDNIYHKYTGNSIFWGVYQISNGVVFIEFLDFVHAWGGMGITRWSGNLNEDNSILTINKGPINREKSKCWSSTFPYEGFVLHNHEELLKELNIQPEKAWINK